MSAVPPFAGAGEVLAVSCGIIWAGAIVMFRKGGECLGVFQANLLKNTVASVCFTISMVLCGVPFQPEGIGAGEFWITILSGFLGIMLADLFLLKALQILGATLTTIFSAAYAPVMVVFSLIFLGETTGPFLFMGGFMVVSAVVVGAMQKETRRELNGRQVVLGGLMVLTQIVLLCGSIIMVDAILDTSALWVSWLRLLTGMVGMFMIMPFRRGGWRAITRTFIPRPGWKWIVWGGLLGNWLACWAWLAAFSYISNTRASVLNELHLVFVFIMAAIFLGEPFTRRRTLAVVLAFSGAVLTLVG